MINNSFVKILQPEQKTEKTEFQGPHKKLAGKPGNAINWLETRCVGQRSMKIRDAGEEDIEEITGIYNDAVVHTTAIWNEKMADRADRLGWLNERQQAGYPVLVAADDHDGVLGYASFADWRAWDGYRHTVEHSVYVRADRRGRGVGEALVLALIERARGLGKHVIVAAIEARNVGSIRLHEKLGFKHAGHLKQVGTKFGSWLDLAFLQFMLDERAVPDDIGEP